MTSTAFNQADLIRRVAAPEPIASMEALAADLGRDSSNVRKSVKALAAEGVFDWTPGSGAMPALTDLGRQVLRGIDVAQGNADLIFAGSEGVAGAAVWPADKIIPNPLNRAVKPEKVAARADSIAERGLIQPLSLTPIDANGVRMLVDGEYRWRAHLLTVEQGRPHPSLADGLPFVEREVSEEEALAITIVANTERENLSPWEDAQQLFKIAELTGKSGAEIARLLGRPGAKDVQDKIRLAREATPDQIAAYQDNGSWDAFRNAVFGRSAPSQGSTHVDPDMRSQGEVMSEWVAAQRENETRAAEPDAPTDPWLVGGWMVLDPEKFGEKGFDITGTIIAPVRALIPGARTSPLLTVYHRTDQQFIGDVEDRRLGDVTLYRARATITLPDGRVIESSRIPGAKDRTAAIQLATEDLMHEGRDDVVLIRPAIEWLDGMSGEHVVGGRNCYNATNAQERRFALGWDKRESNSGGGLKKAIEALAAAEAEPPALPGTETDGETPLSSRAVLALVELAHKVRAAPRDPLSGERHDPENVEDIGVPQLAASVGKFWLDGTWNDLLTRQLVRGITLPGGVPPMATLTDRGMSAIDRAGFAFPLDIDDLGDAQVSAGLIARDGYATDWIANEVAAPPPPAEVADDDDQPELIDHWDRDPAAVAADEHLLAEVEAFFEIRDDIDEDAARALMKRLAIEGPFTEDGDAGIVGLVDGATASFGLIDPEHQMPSERKRAVGLLVAWALEVVFGEPR